MPRFRGINRAINSIASTFEGSAFLKSGAYIRSRAVASNIVNNSFKSKGAWAWGRMGMYGGIGAGAGAAGGYADDGDLGGAFKGAGLGVLAGGAALAGVGAYRSPLVRSEYRGAQTWAKNEWAARAAAGRRTAAAKARMANGV